MFYSLRRSISTSLLHSIWNRCLKTTKKNPEFTTCTARRFTHFPLKQKKNNNKKTEKKYILLMLLLTSLFIFILSATVVLSWKSFATLKTCTLISICVYGIPPTIVNGNEPQHWHGKCVNSSSYRVGMILWWCKYDDNFPLNSNIYKKQQQQHEQTLAIKKSQTNWETRVWLLHCEQFYA